MAKIEKVKRMSKAQMDKFVASGALADVAKEEAKRQKEILAKNKKKK